MLHKRKCWDCGNVAEHEDNVVPHVNCKACGSQDTRWVKDKLHIAKQAALVCARESCATEMAKAVAKAFLELRGHVEQLAMDHPDTAVTWPHNGLTQYRTIEDWAAFVLDVEK